MISVRKTISVMVVIALTFTAIAFSYSGSYGVSAITLPVNSRCAELYDMTAGKVIYSKNINQQARTASLAKILVAITVLDHVKSLNKYTATVSDDYDYIENVDETSSNIFQIGEKAKIRDYLYASLFVSAADASMTLARYLGNGSVSKGMNTINKEAASLGMKHTHLDNPIGTDSAGTYSTCSDMTILMRYALRNMTFKSIFCGRSYTIAADNKNVRRTILHSVFIHASANTLIGGGKLGYTPKAKKCLASYARIGGHEYICVTFRAVPTTNNSYPNISDAEKLFGAVQSSAASGSSK
ncbi:MAG: serine hydrolase [Eubacteriaceae bacterium]|nr:serine hydrolase [Eubacteriaceae bacterium]